MLARREQRLALIGQVPLEPAAEPWHGRERGEGLEVWQLGSEAVDDTLDEEIAEADTGKPALAVRDRIENRGVGFAGVAHGRIFIEQRLHVVSNPLDERHLDKDERLLRHARMEIGEASPIRFEPVLEI